MAAAPSRQSLCLLGAIGAAALAALLGGIDLQLVSLATLVAVLALLAAVGADYAVSRRRWRASNVRFTRRLPAAFAIGVERPVRALLEHDGDCDWKCALYDHVDSSLTTAGLPQSVVLPRAKQLETSYAATPTRRGEITFAPAELRVRSRAGLCDLRVRVGTAETRRVYPDFAEIARYAWLAGDRRLQEIGIKTFVQRGEGTDFKQLSEYRYGDSVRHLDWKATLRLDKPIVREFQDERDQRVMLLVDCGRRMRADDRRGAVGTAHFDQVLNAVMLLTYVALAQGDAVGALTFGTPPGQERMFAPRKGAHTLNALMGELYGVQPTPSHSDYVAAAQDLLRRQNKRALVIVITNFRDEDGSELGLALKLLRQRHLVLLASVRERIVGELITQPLSSGDAALEVASAHLYEQSRRDAFRRLSARDALMVDAEPERLGIELVNRYHAVKRAGMI
ncbi:MAG TPA: DUF58 domain-containing protein [Gammaproteobacteria bacterium]